MTIDYLQRPIESGLTLRKLRSSYGEKGLKTVLVDLSEGVRLDTTDDVMLTLTPKEGKDSKPVEVPYNGGTMHHLAGLLDIPVPFLKRQDADVQGDILRMLLDRKKGDVLFEFTEDAIQEIRPPHLEKIDPRKIIDVAAKVVGDDAQVIDGWKEPGEYRFDVVVKDGAPYGIGGDRKVNDLTKGGLRFGQDTKHRLAPWVQPFYYRLICTNGMEVQTPGLQVSFRGNTVAEVLAELELAARRAFEEVEHQIDSFYDLRNKKVGDASQMVARIGRERKLSDRMVTDLIERLPALMEDVHDASMFDVVNAVTNYANLPGVFERAESRRKFEVAGGAIVSEHAERCPRCQGTLV